jgi:aminoglycoside/choline kinase family phosphotransferase
MDDPKIPVFDKQFMLNEMALCNDWFLKKYLSLQLEDNEVALIQQTMDWLATEVEKQPKVFIHRDYHSRNLMVLDGQNQLGVIDFQDAMYGPFTYDLVSLLKDCYIYWPRDNVMQWLAFFYERSSQAQQYHFSDFVRAFDLCGLQRHLKVLGIFCRLHLRDNKPGYLGDLPLTLKYTLECCETYEALHPFFHFLQKRVYLP